MGPAFHLQMMTERAFTAIVDRGNLQVFTYITQTFPEDIWMRRSRLTVLKLSLRKNWKPMSLELIRQSEQRAKQRWYQSEAAFVAVTLVSCIVSFLIGQMFDTSAAKWRTMLATIAMGCIVWVLTRWFQRARNLPLFEIVA